MRARWACLAKVAEGLNYAEATRAANADCRSDPASWKAPASKSLGAGSSGRGADNRK